MHLETLKLFCDLADSHSFSKTAEKHLVSQSAVSQQLAQLELSYKCQLVTRRTRPIELTAAGQVFYRAARDILERHDQLKSELHSLEIGVDIRINVAAIFSIGMHSLNEYIKKFMIRYPNVNVHIEYFTAERIYEIGRAHV
jgi:DNA-binding transcriptional LysR family regulator